MLKTLRNILSIGVLVLALYGLITENFEYMPYLMIALSFLMLTTGVIELQKDKKAFWGYMCIGVSGFAFYVSIQGFLYQ
ncbi:DUF3953 domain-containing protein [Pradoshia sp. D12]|uniref:DUF3953 domain-containing protein n=1 Tax=Bacillaceae TaxID=186817 RepID=UPI0011289D8E|nr:MULTISPECIES: DUF3953 domain-containing protein [Bacillaceae]QFK72369.1 DUF3953 domain-containing protein [Pradoshia sp. D12]TPF71138.1 DUF3953 domain-containing protein [Bacillus sp. D12]